MSRADEAPDAADSVQKGRLPKYRRSGSAMLGIRIISV